VWLCDAARDRALAARRTTRSAPDARTAWPACSTGNSGVGAHAPCPAERRLEAVFSMAKRAMGAPNSPALPACAPANAEGALSWQHPLQGQQGQRTH